MIKNIKKQLIKEINSLRNKKYGYLEAGLPKFGRLFGRDSLITGWQLLDFEPDIAKNTLKILAKFQGKKVNPKKDEEPGKILHEHQIGKRFHPQGIFPVPYYGSVDSTPLFLILLSFYFRKTNDKELLKLLWPNVLRAIDWLFHFGDKDNDYFLEYKRKDKRGVFHQGWKDSFENHLGIKPPVAIVEAQGYQYMALKEISKIAGDFFKDKKLTKSLRQRAEKLKKEFNKKFWLPKERYYALALDSKKRKKREITSNPGHLLFTGIIQDKKREKAVVKKLFSAELWTDYGLRTHSSKEANFNALSYHRGSVWPHDNWIIAQGLKKLGYKKEYQKIKKALLEAYRKIGFIPEFYVVIENKITTKAEIKPCYPQAWACAALLNFLLN